MVCTICYMGVWCVPSSTWESGVYHLLHGSLVCTIRYMGVWCVPSATWESGVYHLLHGSLVCTICYMGVWCLPSATWESGVYHLLHQVSMSVRREFSATECLSALFSVTPHYNYTQSAQDVSTELYVETV